MNHKIVSPTKGIIITPSIKFVRVSQIQGYVWFGGYSIFISQHSNLITLIHYSILIFVIQKFPITLLAMCLDGSSHNSSKIFHKRDPRLLATNQDARPLQRTTFTTHADTQEQRPKLQILQGQDLKKKKKREIFFTTSDARAFRKCSIDFFRNTTKWKPKQTLRESESK